MLFGVIGGILLILVIILTHKFSVKTPYVILIYPLIMFSAILFYKIRQKNDVNYWRAVIMILLVYSIMTLGGVWYIKIMSFLNDGISLFRFSLIPFLKLVSTGIISSLIAGLFFLKFKRKT
ncbi:MAG: hypothetical protein COA97_08955 [Flavobacteriales bacterium]|nr:MAG: hypothetical protein COA97_08955 [Flavobacteriales bacterium]